MAMLTGIKKDFTKAEELHYGELIQEGLAAKAKLENEVVSDKEREELLAKIDEGNAAQEKLFTTYIALANKLARSFRERTKSEYSLEDLQQDAYSALYEATLTYNPKKNCVLTTHAYYRISKALSVNINKMRAIRLPENKMGDYLAITRAENKFDQMTNGVAHPYEKIQFVMNETKLDKPTIDLIKNAMRGTASLNTPLGEDGGEMGDLLADKREVQEQEIQDPTLIKTLADLTQFEKDILSYKENVGRPSMSLSDFLVKYNMTEEEVMKKGKSILRALRKRAKRGDFD